MSSSPTPTLTLIVWPEPLAVCRLEPHAPIPGWVAMGNFWSITRTPAELSLVCLDAAVPSDVRCERPWRCIEVAGPLDFALTGILAAIAQPLAAAGISIFAIATYDTDYLLVRAERLAEAIDALRAAGHTIRP